MPKAKWSATDLTADDIDEVEEDDFQPYAGPTPPAGLYRFILKRSQKGVSSNGNDMITNLLILDGSWKKEHAKYDGCPVWDHIAIKKSTRARVRSFIDALGVSSKDFLNKTVVDEDGLIQKIGSLKVTGANLELYVDCEREESEQGPRIRPRFRGYLPSDSFDDSDEDDEDEDEDQPEEPDEDEDEDDESQERPKKVTGKAKGKRKASSDDDDDEPPF